MPRKVMKRQAKMTFSIRASSSDPYPVPGCSTGRYSTSRRRCSEGTTPAAAADDDDAEWEHLGDTPGALPPPRGLGLGLHAQPAHPAAAAAAGPQW